MQKTSPWAFIPSLYFLEGLPYILINAVSVVLYTDLGLPADQITFWTGWLYLPWILKMFWSPLVDSRSTKRRWLLGAQGVLGLVCLGIFAALFCSGLHRGAASSSLFAWTLLGFWLGAFASATYDIAADGYYLLALSVQDQARFVGIRTIFYRLAMIAGSGLLVAAVGHGKTFFPLTIAWAGAFLGLGLLFLLGAWWHRRILPAPAADRPAAHAQGPVWADAFKTYFTQSNILYILLFILLYRIGDALLEKTVVPFLLRPQAERALGLSLASYGLLKGTLGLSAVIAGNLAGGWLLSRYGFKRCIWPFALALILPNFFYAYMAWALPGPWVAGALITLEHFGNGLAMMAFSVFVMYISQGAYKTSHYAISTGIMALGMMGPSMLSGKLQMLWGYEKFFLFTALFSLVSLLIIPLIFKIKSIEETERVFRQHTLQLGDGD